MRYMYVPFPKLILISIIIINIEKSVTETPDTMKKPIYMPRP